MNEIRMGIGELATMSRSEGYECVRGRVIDMYERIGDVEGAVAWLWIDLDSRQH